MYIQYINITIVRRKERESKIDYKMWDAQCRNRMNPFHGRFGGISTYWATGLRQGNRVIITLT